MKRVTLELQLSFQFVASVKVKAYFLEAPINVSGAAQGQMVGSVIRKKVISTVFIFLSGALGGSSEANRGQFHQGKVTSTASIFL